MTGKLDLEVVAVDEPEMVVRDADIVATCTDSTRTVFDEPDWLVAGPHYLRAPARWGRKSSSVVMFPELGKNTIEAMDEGMVRLHGNVGYIAGQPRSRIPNPVVDNYRGDHFKYFHGLQSRQGPGRTNDKRLPFSSMPVRKGFPVCRMRGESLSIGQRKGRGRELPTEWFLQDIRD